MVRSANSRTPCYLNLISVSPMLGGRNLYTNTARKRSPQTPWRLFGVYAFSFFFPSKPLFLPVEALEFSELKTPLVYTFFPPICFTSILPLCFASNLPLLCWQSRTTAWEPHFADPWHLSELLRKYFVFNFSEMYR